MADNVAITAGTGTTVATDDIGGVHYQRVKQNYGIDGASADGGTLYRSLDVQNTGEVIKASAGRLLRLVVRNRNAAERFLKLYNKATAPTSADTPVATLSLPASSGPVNIDLGEAGGIFSTGISMRACTGIADADNTAPTANDIVTVATYV